MSTIDRIAVEIAILLGSAKMPVHQLLRMGRGAVIELDATADDEVTILANDIPVARGQVILQGEHIAIRVTQILRRDPMVRQKAVVR